MKKRIVFIGVIGVVLNSAWFAYSKITAARRETAYQKTVASYQHDLSLGTTRAEVQNYLEARKLDYHRVRVGGEEADRLQIQIATEPGSLICEEWRVYVVLGFNTVDRLTDVRVSKMGTCL
jgi:hypothetical protein